MATIVHPARASARLITRCAPRCASRRAFRASAQSRAAQNFPMPALSPTMTEGNIASWKLKEGDHFSAGDVILEIETDKATMDVEAQDDGILFKIMEAEGAKGVKVGQRIAVFADAGDDVDSLEVPAEKTGDSKSPPAQDETPKAQEVPSTAPEQQQQGGAEQRAEDAPKSPPKQEGAAQQALQKRHSTTLLPSVQQLLHVNGYPSQEAEKIAGSGPNGRVLKGDVLAFLGRISKDYPAQQSQRLKKLAHLDLSNIQMAEKPARKEEPKGKTPERAPPRETEVAVPISLAAVVAIQKRVQDSLGIFLPLSTFIARASELANEELPASRSQKSTADELFNSVLGLDQVSTSSRGHFIPQITGIWPTPLPKVAKATKTADIIDLLAPRSATRPTRQTAVPRAAVGVSAEGNVFSVIAKSGDEARATEYLERMKLALEKEPGRLVL